MRILIVGASRGLGWALVDGLMQDRHEVVGVSRRTPAEPGTLWIEADFSHPAEAVATLVRECPAQLDAIIWNLGVWEPEAFTADYDFAAQSESVAESLVTVNVTSPLLALQALIPRILGSAAPTVMLTGSTSGLRQSGRPEVAFGATKASLNGIADALRENYRSEGLAVTVLQLGNLNTEDGLNVPREEAAARGAGELIPVHVVVDTIRQLLSLSSASYIRELVMPAILDERF